LRKINFAMALHFHQPVDNFDSVFKEAYEKSYKPFIDVLEKYPNIKVTLHYSGSLLEWIESNRPELVKRIGDLAAGGQAEIMTGGFYEPILCVIPRRDAVGQISMLTEYIKNKFHSEAEGLWLTERIWEPHLPSLLHDSGIKYLIIDDIHFRYAGLSESELHGYYSTEDEGKVVFLFPSSEKLRYSIPFREVDETVDYLKSVATEEGDRILVYGDDGEKFGLWPDTYNWVYNERWLERFFEALSRESSWINLTTVGEALKKIRPSGRVYIPTASYREMMEWALPSESGVHFLNVLQEIRNNGKEGYYAPFIRGGFWRNFLEKYPESNNMHKKMLRVSNKVSEITNGSGKPLSPGDIGRSVARNGDGLPPDIYEAYMELWRGQVNCPYWHGIFGGLYLGHLRSAVYRHLIRAERIADDSRHGQTNWIESEIYDFDCDGSDEILVTNPAISLVVDSHKGGMITEFDYRPASFNILNTLARRPEVYHQKILSSNDHGHSEGAPSSIHDISRFKEADLHLHLHYDSYRRGMLIDHLFCRDTSLESVMQNRHTDIGRFPYAHYNSSVQDVRNGKNIILEGDGIIDGAKISITKNIRMEDASPDLEINYSIKHASGGPLEIWFGPEFNFSMLDGRTDICRYYTEGGYIEDARQSSRGEIKDVSSFGIENKLISTKIGLSFSESCTLWRFPVETVSQSESGFEKEYQSSVLIPNWKFKLEEGGVWSVTIRLTLREIQ